MKKEVLIWVIIGVVGVLFLYNKLFPKNMETQISEAFKKALLKYGKAVTSNVEKIYRLETANFTSGQFIGTYSPGMEKQSNSYPYGWNTMKKKVWDIHPEYKPTGLKTFTENGTGKKKTFVQFPSFEAALMSVCEFIKATGNNPGRWFSLDPFQQASYNTKINGIKSYITDGIA
jgi:hypothetical protein